MTNEERKQFIEAVLRSQSVQEQRLQEWTMEKYFAALETITTEQFGKEYWELRKTFAEFARRIDEEIPYTFKNLFGDTRWRRVASALDMERYSSDQKQLENAIKSGNVYPLIENYVAAMLELQSFLRAKALTVMEKANAGMKRVSLHDLENIALESGITKQQWQTALREARESKNYAEMLKLNPFDSDALAGVIATLHLHLCNLAEFDITVLSRVSEMEKVASESDETSLNPRDYSLWFKDEAASAPASALLAANKNAEAATPSIEYFGKIQREAEMRKKIWAEQERKAKMSFPKLKSAEEILAPYRRLLSEMQPYMEKIWFLLLNDGKPYRDEKDTKHLNLARFLDDKDNREYLIYAAARYEASLEMVEILASQVPVYLKPVEKNHRSRQGKRLFETIGAFMIIFVFIGVVAWNFFRVSPEKAKQASKDSVRTAQEAARKAQREAELTQRETSRAAMLRASAKTIDSLFVGKKWEGVRQSGAKQTPATLEVKKSGDSYIGIVRFGKYADKGKFYANENGQLELLCRYDDGVMEQTTTYYADFMSNEMNDLSGIYRTRSTNGKMITEDKGAFSFRRQPEKSQSKKKQ